VRQRVGDKTVGDREAAPLLGERRGDAVVTAVADRGGGLAVAIEAICSCTALGSSAMLPAAPSGSVRAGAGAWGAEPSAKPSFSGLPAALMS
jgi:hypothetical protein